MPPTAVGVARRPGRGLWGSNWTLLLSACLTFAAVSGEIATLGLLFWEILGGGFWGHFVVWIAIAAEALATWYFLMTIPRVAAVDWEGFQRRADKAATSADRRRMEEFARILHREIDPERCAAGEQTAVTIEELRGVMEDYESPDADRKAAAAPRLQFREPTDEIRRRGCSAEERLASSVHWAPRRLAGPFSARPARVRLPHQASYPLAGRVPVRQLVG